MNINTIEISRRTACKTLVFGALACAAGDLAEQPANASGIAKLEYISPEAAGVDPQAIAAFIDEVNDKVGGLHSFMLLRHGSVVAEGWWAQYAKQFPHMLYSLSKSFTSTAVGLAISSGRLSLDAHLISFFPDKLPAVQSDNLKAMQVRHMLMMATGHDQDATGPTTAAADGDWAKAFLALPVQHEPGTFFVYNSASTYMLSAIVQKVTGKTVLDYLKPLLFDPIGVEHPTWETCPRGINCGGWGLSIKTEDIARFGQLYLQNGKWGGKQIVPEVWVADATTRKISNGDPAAASDWSQGYCYQFWRCRHGAVRGDGAFGQFCVMMPEQDAVLAITSGVNDMQAILNAAWDKLLPGISIGATNLQGEPDHQLKEKIAALEVKHTVGKRASAIANQYLRSHIHLEPNGLKFNSISIDFAGGRCAALLKTDAGSYPLHGGDRGWIRGEGCRAKGAVGLTALVSNKAAGRGAWVSNDTYELTLCYYETPYIDTVTFKFNQRPADNG